MSHSQKLTPSAPPCLAGDEFYLALAANADRWNAFVESGARVTIPDGDARYRDTANSLLSMYMNTDRGLLPEYRGGEFPGCQMISDGGSR